MEQLFIEITKHVALMLEAFAVLVIAIGGLEAAYHSIFPWLAQRTTHGRRRMAWLSFARWLLLALEFMLAADIIRTIISPSWEEIGQLAAIAVIRTFLNYFLERDLREAQTLKEEL